jgi:uracil phosphoribosyltransferase
MMQESDRSYIVLDDRNNRSMKEFILEAVLSSNHRIYQISPTEKDDCGFVFHDGIRAASLSGLLDDLRSGSMYSMLDCSSSPASQLLATQSRRSDLAGPDLQDIHRRIGVLLSQRLLNEYGDISDLVRPEQFTHVQGSCFLGLSTNIDNMMILPLLRGGEPMSRGVYQCFPNAKLVHYIEGKDNFPQGLLDGVTTVLVVDSVINRGNSIIHVLDELLGTSSTPDTDEAKDKASSSKSPLQIFVLTAVTQRNASISLPKAFPRVRFLTLRISDNQYTGKGGTDTGNRLFGTF